MCTARRSFPARLWQAAGKRWSGKAVSVEQHMTPGTYIGEAYGKWKEGTIEGERFGSPAVIVPMKVAVTVDETCILKVEVSDCSDTPGFMLVLSGYRRPLWRTSPSPWIRSQERR